MSSQFSNTDAQFSTDIFTRNNPIILACDRHQATILGVRVAWTSAMPAAPTGYLAGTVMARRSSDGYYVAYQNSATGGVGTAVGVLFETVLPASGDTLVARLIVRGNVYQQKLTGLDNNAITNLNARSITDGFGDQILVF